MKAYKSYLDSFSISVSVLCVAHCIILPIFLSTLSLWGIELLENKYIELLTLLTTLIAGSWAIGKGFIKYHQHLAAPALFVLGMIPMIIANYVEAAWWESILKGSGAICIISAHITNWRKCQACCRQ